MNYDTFVKKMYEGNRLTLNQIAQLLNHQDSLVVEGAIDIFNILQRDQLIDSIDAGVWANRLGSVCKRHPALEHPACFAISMLGESDSTKRAFWKYASLPLLSDDGPTVFWAQLALTRVDPASAAQLGITRHAPIPFEEDEPVLTEHQRAKVKELIKTYGSLNP